MSHHSAPWYLYLYLKAASANNSEKNAQEDDPAETGNLLRTLAGPEFSIALGMSILLAVLTNRLATPELIDSQARTDILGVIASGGLVTNGVYLLVRSREQFFSFACLVYVVHEESGRRY